MSLLEMDCEVGDQRRGRNVHPTRRAEQNTAELCALELYYVESGPLKRNSHHLECVGAVGFRHRELFRGTCGLTAEHGLRSLRFGYAVEPRKYVAGLWLRNAPERSLEASHQVANARPRITEHQLLARDLSFEIAHRKRQHGIGPFDNPEARGKLGKRRKLAGRNSHWEPRRISKFAARVIGEFRWNLNPVLRRLPERPLEGERRHVRRIANRRTLPRSIRPNQRDLLCLRDGDWRGKRDRHRRQRDTSRFRVLALAMDRRLEGSACLVVESLILNRRDAALRFYSFAPNQADLAIVGEALLRLQNHDRLFAGEIFETLEHNFAIGAVHDRDANSLRHAFNRKSRVLENRRLVSFRIQHQQKRLALIYIGAPRPRPLLDDRRSAGIKAERLQIGKSIARQRLQARTHSECASLTCGQIVVEVE